MENRKCLVLFNHIFVIFMVYVYDQNSVSYNAWQYSNDWEIKHLLYHI